MSLKYTCPGCGTPLGYEGLCWKCKSEQERKAALAWTPEQTFVAQRCSTAGTGIFECHRIHLLSEYKKHLASACHRDRPTQGVKDRKRGTVSGFRYRKLLRLYSFFYLNGGLPPIDTTHRNLSLLLSTNKSRICTAAGTA